jgi:sporulation related protein
VPEPEPRQSWAMPAAIIAAIALLAVGAVVFALNQVESDAEKEATKPTLVVKPPTPPGSGDQPADVATWPAGTSAYTVALAETPDETAARARAAAAATGGVPAGVLQSDAYPSLDPGMWVLFAGRFDTRAEAEAEATRYVASGFPDAKAVFVSD